VQDISSSILEWYQLMGVDEISAHDPKAIISDDEVIHNSYNDLIHTPVTINANRNAPPSKFTPKTAPIERASLPHQAIDEATKLADAAKTIEELEEMVRNFNGCSLKKTANKTVFCDGNNQAKVMLIGEAPGANEDIEGIPFCGDSGKLLDSMLKFIGLTRKNFYITNSIFWRPPGNRKPTPEEIKICRPFVEKHIALVNPDLIILVGATAVASVLDQNTPMAKMRQQFHKYTNKYTQKEINTTAIFHPSFLLRQPSQKKQMWEDLLVIQEFLGS
jgi:uracil-DNA glycosylase family 4